VKIHEYQGKQIFREYGIPTPRGFAATSVDGAVEAAKKLGGRVWVVKAQIHAGGRGKGGGVKYSPDRQSAIENVGRIAGMPVGPLSLNDEVAVDLAWKILKATEADLGAKAINPRGSGDSVPQSSITCFHSLCPPSTSTDRPTQAPSSYLIKIIFPCQSPNAHTLVQRDPELLECRGHDLRSGSWGCSDA